METDQTEVKEWFREWFNSPYYHILYRDRNYAEAELFLEKLGQLLHFHSGHRMLDIACGKGRHSIYLNSKGFDVTGIDISPESIAYASQVKNERLHFYVHDMRKPFGKEQFDYVLNLFTSFGYFETDQENMQAICTATRALTKDGKLVLDFFNTPKVIQHLPPYEAKKVEGITFEIRKSMEDDFILKDIDFEVDGESYHFQERVEAIGEEDFRRYFEEAGLEVMHLFGDYRLNQYNPETSDRMIFIAQKKYEAK